MSIHDERDLRARLGTALDEVVPSPLPLGAVIRQGRAVMVRRRLVAVTAVAAVAAAAIAGPVLARQIGRSQGSSAGLGRYHVTVYPPGPRSPKDLIAYGRVNGHPWRATADRSGPSTVCFRGYGKSCDASAAARASSKGDPAEIFMRSGTRPQVDFGTVRSDVAYLRVGLSNGQTLTLRPVAIFGARDARYVAFAVPDAAAVTVVSAYSARGEIGYADPFTGLGSVQTVRWLRPGQPASDVFARYLIGSGSVAGEAWSEYAFTGPFGSCLGGAGAGSTCAAVGLSKLRGSHIAQQLIESFDPGGTGFLVYGVAPAVSYLVVTAVDGRTVRVRPVRAGGARFCSFASDKDNKASRWAAYSAAGVRLATGSVP